METTNTRSTSGSGPRAPAGRPYVMVIGGARVGELHELARERTVVGRGPDAQIRLGDTGVSREHAELLVSAGRVSVRDLGSTNGTFLNGVRADARGLADGDKLVVGAATLLVFTGDDGLEREYQRGRVRAAVRDPATTALKREVFLERLVEEVSFARRHGAALAVLAWELDGFAALDDELGPTATGRTLAAAARAARDVLEDDDLLATLGPGKFGVACREAGAGAAGERAARLRAAIARATFEPGETRARLTASVGVAIATAGSNKSADAARELLARADAALTAARERGGDRVELDAAARDPGRHEP
jgi:two-component system, cell cycle response regulator